MRIQHDAVQITDKRNSQQILSSCNSLSENRIKKPTLNVPETFLILVNLVRLFLGQFIIIIIISLPLSSEHYYHPR